MCFLFVHIFCVICAIVDLFCDLAHAALSAVWRKTWRTGSQSSKMVASWQVYENNPSLLASRAQHSDFFMKWCAWYCHWRSKFCLFMMFLGHTQACQFFHDILDSHILCLYLELNRLYVNTISGLVSLLCTLSGEYQACSKIRFKLDWSMWLILRKLLHLCVMLAEHWVFQYFGFVNQQLSVWFNILWGISSMEQQHYHINAQRMMICFMTLLCTVNYFRMVIF